jgi:ferredoxin
MKRNIIKIDSEKCNGCGLCVNACHEGALQIIEGKAVLISESYCDGLGNCLPECPAGAIIIEEREADNFNEEAVREHIAKGKQKYGEMKKMYDNDKENVHKIPDERDLHTEKHAVKQENLACGCPGTHSRSIERKTPASASTRGGNDLNSESRMKDPGNSESQLRQWPCQIKLVPVNAPYFNNAHLLVAADCSAFAYADFHQDFIRNKITIIGCPKLDEINYAEKLTEILKRNEIKSITVVRMEVPCCGGIVHAVKNALLSSGKMIPWSVVTISTDGNIIDE